MTVRSVAVKTGSILQIALATVSSTHEASSASRECRAFGTINRSPDDPSPRVFGCTQGVPDR